MKRNLFIAMIILLAAIGIAFYITFNKQHEVTPHELPEECFVNEMKTWSIKNNKQVGAFTQKNAKLAVSKAKAILNETKLDSYKKDDKILYLEIVALFEYCGINRIEN